MSNIQERAKNCAIKCIEWCYRENKDTNDENYVTHCIEDALRTQQRIDKRVALAMKEEQAQNAIEWPSSEEIVEKATELGNRFSKDVEVASIFACCAEMMASWLKSKIVK